MPISTMMNVIARAGATFTSLRISAAINPAFSATPTPIMATKMTATTLKLAKFVTNDEKMKRAPAIEIRLSIFVVSVWTTGCGFVYAGGTSGTGCSEPPTYVSSTGIGGTSATSYVTLMFASANTHDSTITRMQSPKNISAGWGTLLP